MRTIVVQYETKPERAEENQQLVEKVFTELSERRPEGFRYASFRLEDGVSFVHVVAEDGDGSFSLAELPAFAEFQREIGDRCAVQPVARGATIVGNYGLVTD